MERLLGFAYWPWGKNLGQKLRSNVRHKNAVLVCSAGMPGPLIPIATGAPSALRLTAKMLGAAQSETCGSASPLRGPTRSCRTEPWPKPCVSVAARLTCGRGLSAIARTVTVALKQAASVAWPATAMTSLLHPASADYR